MIIHRLALFLPAVISVKSASCSQCIPPYSFLTLMALGQMSVLAPVGGHPALNAFLWEIKGFMHHRVEQRETR